MPVKHKRKTDFKPEIGLILGSGLGDYADGIKVETFVQYAEIEGFPVSTVKGHKGRFVFGYVGETPVVIMQEGSTTMKDTICQTWFCQPG